MGSPAWTVVETETFDSGGMFEDTMKVLKLTIPDGLGRSFLAVATDGWNREYARAFGKTQREAHDRIWAKINVHYGYEP